MKISVVVPVYNEEDYIKSCLDHLMKQKEKADEIIVVDNNCRDRTIEIAQKYPAKIVEEKKQGITFARNKGFNKAKGDIIARCDADVLVPRNWLALIKKNFKKKKVDALCGTVIFYDFWVLKRSTLPANFFIKTMKLILKHYILSGPNLALTKRVWRKVRGEVCLDDKKIHEDIDLSIHIAKHGQIGFDPSLKVLASARRIKHSPLSFLVEYPWRLVKTIRRHASEPGNQ